MSSTWWIDGLRGLGAVVHGNASSSYILLMGTLTVREVDDAVIRKLRVRAAEQGISAEELHRRILRDALAGTSPSAAEAIAVLREMGRLGLDLAGVEDRGPDPPPVEL
jgi:plasmid stability protein